jgi:hypothetical protein
MKKTKKGGFNHPDKINYPLMMAYNKNNINLEERNEI